jgi:hypothetical protein
MNQETLKALKSSAKVISRELQGLGYPAIPHTQILSVLSKSVGFESWNALRAQTGPATTASASEAANTRYPRHYVSATYAAGEFVVDLVKWEDPTLNLGYGFYAYDQATGRCLTPTAPFVFDAEEVPTYEQIASLIDSLEYLGECTVCHYVCEENEGLTMDSRCQQPGCTGYVRPFLKDK